MKTCKKTVDLDKVGESETLTENFPVNENSELGQIYAELKFISNRLREVDYSAGCEDDWKYVAAVFDR